MGLNTLGRSARSYSLGGSPKLFGSNSEGNSTPSPPEPNPKDFSIESLTECHGWTIALVNYPACTTYGGNKLLVYDCGANRVRNQKILDPHFLEKDRLSPIARFEPTERGMALSKVLCSQV